MFRMGNVPRTTQESVLTQVKYASVIERSEARTVDMSQQHFILTKCGKLWTAGPDVLNSTEIRS